MCVYTYRYTCSGRDSRVRNALYIIILVKMRKNQFESNNYVIIYHIVILYWSYISRQHYYVAKRSKCSPASLDRDTRRANNNIRNETKFQRCGKSSSIVLSRLTTSSRGTATALTPSRSIALLFQGLYAHGALSAFNSNDRNAFTII